MHLLFEGVFHLEISLLLSELISQEHCSLPYLNTQIEAHLFHFSCSSDKFARLTSATDFPYKSAQMWIFAFHLPAFVADKVPAESQHWKSFILLLQISQLIMSPFVTDADIIRLEELIASHHDLFVTLYPNNVTPKVHFLIHLPQQMRSFGPARNHACFRLESKHQTAKARQYNFKNICLSISKRFSLVQSCDLFDDQGLPRTFKEPFHTIGPRKVARITTADGFLDGYSCQAAASKSVEMRTGCFIFWRSPAGGKDCIYRVTDLFVSCLTDHSDLYLQVQVCNVTFDSHRNVLIVTDTSLATHVVTHSALLYPWPLIDVTSNDTTALIGKSISFLNFAAVANVGQQQ
jgi:hypothetical protein